MAATCIHSRPFPGFGCWRQAAQLGIQGWSYPLLPNAGVLGVGSRGKLVTWSWKAALEWPGTLCSGVWRRAAQL